MCNVCGKSANHPLAKLGPCEVKRLETMPGREPVVDPEEWPEAVDLIFVTEFGRPVNVNSLVYKHFKPILKRAGLPNIRLYDLRHTAATLALTVAFPRKLSQSNSGTRAQHLRWMFIHTCCHTCRMMPPQKWKPRYLGTLSEG